MPDGRLSPHIGVVTSSGLALVLFFNAIWSQSVVVLFSVNLRRFAEAFQALSRYIYLMLHFSHIVVLSILLFLHEGVKEFLAFLGGAILFVSFAVIIEVGDYGVGLGLV